MILFAATNNILALDGCHHSTQNGDNQKKLLFYVHNGFGTKLSIHPPTHPSIHLFFLTAYPVQGCDGANNYPR